MILPAHPSPKAPPGSAGWAALRTRLRFQGRLLLVAMIVPLVLLGLAALQQWQSNWTAARAELAAEAEAAAEYGLRVLTAHALATGRVNDLLDGLSDAEIPAREQELHQRLRALIAEIPQADGAFVFDREGTALLAAHGFPVATTPGLVADRDFFLELRADGAPGIHVSRVHLGRVDGALFFAVSRRRTVRGADPGAFAGLVNVSAYPAAIGEGLGRVVHTGDLLALVRLDGEVLARAGGLAAPMRLPPGSPFLAAIAGAPARAAFEVPAPDGEIRVHAVRRVEGWPVYAVVARPRSAIVAAWWSSVTGQLAIGLPAAAALLALVGAARRRNALLIHANARLEASAARRGTALARSEAQLAEALRSGRVIAFDIDLATGHAERSPNVVEILGMPAGAPSGPSDEFLARVDPADRPALDAARDALRPEHPHAVCRFRYRRPDGHVVWLEDRAEGQFDAAGRLRRITGLARDITTEVEAERALREGAARLRAATEGVGLGVFELDIASGAAWLDVRGAELAGSELPVERWVPIDARTRACFEARLHPEDRAPLLQAIAADADGSLELRLRRRDGAWTALWCSWSVAERDPAGAARRVVGVVQDVTERHRLEAELRLGQRLQALGALAGGIAHDFNNVLQAVSGTAAIIARRAGDADTVRSRAGAILEAVARGAAVTGRLLAFARRAELRAEPIRPSDLLAGMREVLAPGLGARIRIRVEAPETLPPLLADRGQLETVLVNLAANARDAMPEGGTLVLAALAERVGPWAPAGLAAGRYIRLEVRDDGTGMPPEVLTRAVEPFFTTKPAGEGTGLGLAMAKGFAEQSGGALRIESRPGGGTVVRLWLPESVAAPLPAGPAAAPPPAPAGAPTVLLVDDEEMVRETMVEELEAAGYRVHAAADAAEALALIEAGAAVAALVTDLTMPGMDGLGLIREVRRRRPGLPAVLFTGYADDAVTRSRGDPAEERFVLLRKPISGAEVAATVAGLLDAEEGEGCAARREAAAGAA